MDGHSGHTTDGDTRRGPCDRHSCGTTAITPRHARPGVPGRWARGGTVGDVSDRRPRSSSGRRDRPVHRALGLTDDELADIERILGRAPNHLELAMYSVMWSRALLVQVVPDPPAAPAHRGAVGPGRPGRERRRGRRRRRHRRRHAHREPQPPVRHRALPGRGDRGRRHPARHLHHGRPPDRPDGPAAVRARSTTPGAAGSPRASCSGISGYGNSVGVPTVGGEVVFDETYQDNPLVNVLCLGVLPTDRLVLGQATGVGNLAVLLGSSTGRDGIGGVSVLASAGFGDAEADAAKRPNVQVGDPFEEKRLIEACLALLDAGLVVGIQDLGGAGLTLRHERDGQPGRRGHGRRRQRGRAPRARHGAVRDHDLASPRSGCWPSSSPADLDEVLAICARWEVRAPVSSAGSPTAAACASSTAPTARCWPTCRRPRCTRTRRSTTGRWHRRRPLRSCRPAPRARAAADARRDLLDMLADTCWVWHQYDHQLFLNTVEGPGGDATVLRLKHPTTGRGHRPGPGPHHRRQPPLVRGRPPGRHGAGSWPRRSSTWPASAPGRSPSSTA